MKMKNGFFIVSLSIIMALCFAYDSNAAARTSARPAPTARKSVGAIQSTQKAVEKPAPEKEEVVEPAQEEEKEEFVIINKSSEFETSISEIIESAVPDNSFAEQIRKQRAALAAADASSSSAKAQANALKNNTNTCDRDLRKCMAEKCGNDFTGCALDGDTMFGDKLNSCKTKTSCSATEFNMFVPEIKADRDMNVRVASYECVINCGNQYNACIVNQCGTTYNKCLGKPNADAAIQKCATIAKECTESDSGLANRFGTAIGKLRENAEKEVKVDEERMYKLRDQMRVACESLGAMFDERTFDCVYTVNFFAGENQVNPTASRKRYAGDTFVCMQEWFGINATTFMENAARETRAQTAASSAMLGSGVGTAVGLVTSGAIDRALETQKAKKSLKKECNAQGGKLKKGECVKKDDKRFDDGTPEDPDEEEASTDKNEKLSTVDKGEKTTANNTVKEADGSSTTKQRTKDSDGNTINTTTKKDKDGNTTYSTSTKTETGAGGAQRHTTTTTTKGVTTTTVQRNDKNGAGKGTIDTKSTFDVKKKDASDVLKNLKKPGSK